MAITWTANEVSIYLKSLGIGTARAVAIQTYVERVTTALTYIGRDASLAAVFSAAIRPIIDVADGAYGLGSAALVKAWILANRPDLASVADTLDDVVFTDVLALVDTPIAHPDFWTAKQMYLEQAVLNLTRIVYYLRHFTGMDHPERPGESEYVWSE